MKKYAEVVVNNEGVQMKAFVRYGDQDCYGCNSTNQGLRTTSKSPFLAKLSDPVVLYVEGTDPDGADLQTKPDKYICDVLNHNWFATPAATQKRNQQATRTHIEYFKYENDEEALSNYTVTDMSYDDTILDL